MRLIVILISFIIVLGCENPKMNHYNQNRHQKVEDFLNTLTAKSKIPGIQYVVLDSNSVIFDYAGGLADIKNNIPLKPETTMMAYSMTKTITAAAVIQLYEKGLLNLDDIIDNYLENNIYGSSITIRHLLAQTSGIPSPIPLKWVHLAKDHDNFDEDAELNIIMEKHSKLSFEPGEKYQYSNISYWLLGKIIANVSEMSFTNYIEKNILIPLQLSNDEMNFVIPGNENHAKGYLAKGSFFNLIKTFILDKNFYGKYEGKWLRMNSYYLNGPAFGGLIGSAQGFGKFLQDQLKDESVLFDNETRDLFCTQQKKNNGDFIDMTLGWHIGYTNGKKYLFKEGGGAGYHCEMRVYPEMKLASIIMVNKTNFNSKKYLDTLDKEIFYDF